MPYLDFHSSRTVRGGRGASADLRVNRSASCVSGRCVWEPVTDHRGSILQLVFTVGMTWRTERRAHKAPPPPPARVHAAGGASVAGQSWVCFAVQQLCQCATDSRSDWLELIERAGLSLIADAHARRS